MRVDVRLLSVIGIVLLVGGGLLISSMMLPVQAGDEGDWRYRRPSDDTTNTTATNVTTAPWFNLHYELMLEFLDSEGNLVYTQPFSLYSSLDDAVFDTMQVALLWNTTGEGVVWETFDLDIYISLSMDLMGSSTDLFLASFLDQAITGSVTMVVTNEELIEAVESASSFGLSLPLVVEVVFDFSIEDTTGDLLEDAPVASLEFTIGVEPITNAAAVTAFPSLMGMSSTTGGLNPMTNAAIWPILLGGLLLVYFYVLPWMGGRKR